MELFHLISILIVFASTFGYINARFIKLPTTIGLMLISILFSIGVLVLGKYFPTIISYENKLMAELDFRDIVLNGILSFLLFAGALQVDLSQLRKQRLPVILFSTFGVLISTFLVSVFLYYSLSLLGIQIPYLHCLVFGALISPTDPVAIMGILKKVGIIKSLEVKIVGESLFNDGVGYVLFLTVLNLAQSGSGGGGIEFQETALLFLKEVGGGFLLGGGLGWITYLALGRIDDYEVEVMITLALVMGGYTLAEQLAISGPITMVVGGLIIGDKLGNKEIVSERSEIYVTKFWDLMDVLFNAFLFLLIGLEILIVDFNKTALLAGLLIIPLVILSRYLSLKVLILSLSKWVPFESKTTLIMTWGGLRGGISIAMALSLPGDISRDILITITYCIVIFSILVQGLTLAPLVKKYRLTGE
ncbi:MAG: sodium:proton antiporter [Leeuwenhoekiella sp.]